MSEPPSRSSEEIEREMRRHGMGYERPLQVTLGEVQAQKQNRTGDKNVGRKPSSTHNHDHKQEIHIMSNVGGTQSHEASRAQAHTNSAPSGDPAAIEARRILEDNYSVKRELLRSATTAAMTVALAGVVVGVAAFFTKPVAVIPDPVPMKK